MFDFADDRLNGIFAQMFPAGARTAPSGRARHDVVPMVIERDPATRRITRVETQPHDTPEALALIERLLHLESTLERPTPPSGEGQISIGPGAARGPETGCAATAPAPQAQPATAPNQAVASPWLGDAIKRYGEQQVRTKKMSQNTLDYSHLPSLRVFRELISDSRRLDGDEDTAGTWDIRLADITPARIDAFLEQFWTFPSRQGRRPDKADAKEVLAQGGPPQSEENVLKRLGHVRQLFENLVKRDELDKRVLGTLKAEIEDIDRGNRDAASGSNILADPDHLDEDDGYVAFTADETKRLFNPEVYVAHAAGHAARYFIPLLGRYTAGRLNEIAQATVQDVRLVHGIPCLCVTSNERHATGDVQSVVLRTKTKRKRLKTKAGRRVLPLHPELIRLGFLEYVEERKQGGHRFLFDLRWSKKDGFGKYPGRDFQTLSKAVGVWSLRRKVFHSFRSTLAQELEATKLDGTLIDRVLGHAIPTVRARHYSRNSDGTTMPLQVVLDALCEIPGMPALPPWGAVARAKRRQLRRLCTLDVAPDGAEAPRTEA